MTEFETKIYNIIASSNGIKGSEIAKNLQVDKKEVNSALANSYALKALVILLLFLNGKRFYIQPCLMLE